MHAVANSSNTHPILPRMTKSPKIRLRYDKVALSLLKNLRQSLEASVRAGDLLVVTCTAPIRKDSATAKDAAEAFRKMLVAKRTKAKLTSNGNRLEARLLRGVGKGGPKVIGYVHNPDVDPGVLFDVTEASLRALMAASG
jgi:hypothetical protein